MKNKFISTWFYAGLLKETKTEKGFFRSKETETFNETAPDLDQFAQMLADAYTNFDEDGYDVINVVPIALGSSAPCVQKNGKYVGDVGFSPTRGAVVIGKLKEE